MDTTPTIETPVPAQEAAPAPQRLTISDLINQIAAAYQRMGNKNPHKQVLAICANAISDLAERLTATERKLEAKQMELEHVREQLNVYELGEVSETRTVAVIG